MKHAWLSLAFCACAACDEAPARDQWIVVLATDAPVPQLGNRLYVELVDQDGAVCDGCAQLFDARSVELWPVTFGALPPVDGRTLRVRARLYRAIDAGVDGLPSSDWIIDRAGVLPSPSGVTSVLVELGMACFGIPGDPDNTCDPASATLAPAHELPPMNEVIAPGSWAPARTIDCAEAPPVGMVCIPGGVILLGDPRGSLIRDDERARPEQFVQVPPFFIDVDELTAADMKALVARGLREPFAKTGPGTVQELCTYDPTSTAGDGLPVNCVTHDLAVDACAALGKRLPTEAEWERAAGNIETESSYPWGEDTDVCEKAIVARGRFASPIGVQEALQCRTIGDQTVDAGPVAGGHPMDATALGVHNMGGNVGELVADAFVPYGSGCWSEAPRLMIAPRCDDAVEPRSFRGGSWSELAFLAHGYERSQLPNAMLADDSIGFRCALSATPAR